MELVAAVVCRIDEPLADGTRLVLVFEVNDYLRAAELVLMPVTL